MLHYSTECIHYTLSVRRYGHQCPTVSISLNNIANNNNNNMIG